VPPAEGHRTRDRDVVIGSSGWRYRGWRGVFYRRSYRNAPTLHLQQKKFNSSGPNTLHNGLQLDDFIFVVKGSRFITHVKKIRNVEGALANFPRRAYFALTRSWGQYFGSFRTGLLLISKTGKLLQIPDADDEGSGSYRWRTSSQVA
jgi:hypothetical protein